MEISRNWFVLTNDRLQVTGRLTYVTGFGILSQRKVARRDGTLARAMVELHCEVMRAPALDFRCDRRKMMSCPSY